MIRYKPSALEWLTVVIMFPIILLTTGYQLFGNMFFSDLKVFVLSSAAIFVISILMWYVQVNMIFFVSGRYAQYGQMWARLMWLLVLDVLVISCNMFIVFYGFDAVGFLGYRLSHDKFLFATGIGLIVTTTGITLCETEYTFKKWKGSLANRELAELQYLQQEFENLIRQINPHFLFNNLNALSSLIGTDPGKAEYFLDELSKVYRYLMRNNMEGISTLKSELTFIHSYVELLKIRYNEAVFLSVLVGRAFEEYLLPSLSLQLLVENVVKHNIARKSQPLFVTIKVQDDHWLVVENNLQKKPGTIQSNHVGLSNISIKYKMLNQPGIVIEQDQKMFRVKLPLLKSADIKDSSTLESNVKLNLI